MMKKILSVCIPTYNMEAYLSRCLDSFIITKEYMDQLEVIIVNDGSKDNSSKIAHAYADRYPNTFIVLDKSNGNYGSCINAALKIATGKYFRICDADDRYEQKNIEEYISFLNQTNADIVLSPFYTMDFDSQIIKRTKVPSNLLGKDFFIDDVDWNAVDFFAMHHMATLSSLLINNNYYQTEGISYTDGQFIFYSFMYSKTCTFFAKPIYYYYLGRDGQTMSKSSMMKSHDHFYMNAERMLADFMQLSSPICENRRNILLFPIKSQLTLYSIIILKHLAHSKEQRKKLKKIIEKSKTSNTPCDILDTLLKDYVFKLWYKYHVPLFFVRILRRIYLKKAI